MKFSVSKDAIIKGLQMVQSVISPHPTFPILKNVAIKAEKGHLNLIVTDLNVSMNCIIEADVGKEGSTTFDARRIFSIVKELPQDQVEFDVDEKDVAEMRCGASYYKLYGMNFEDFPPMPMIDKAVEGAVSYTVAQIDFREMMKKTCYAASDDESRQILNGVLLSFKNQKLTVVATDGRRLALVEQELEVPTEKQMDVVIPTKTVGELLKLLGDKGNLTISATQKLVSFEIGNTVVVSKLVEGTYPNYLQVIPAQNEQRIPIERESFLAALRRVSLINDKTMSVKMTFMKNKLVLTTTSPDVGEATENLPIKFGGKDLEVTFNPDYLVEALKTLTSDEIYFELTDMLSPSVIKCDIPFLYVIMPLRLS